VTRLELVAWGLLLALLGAGIGFVVFRPWDHHVAISLSGSGATTLGSEVSRDWDGVHLSIGGWLTAEDVPHESAGVKTELRGWGWSRPSGSAGR
jgi:hypothetical protein